MPLDNPRGGFGYAPEFQVSALPWVLSTTASTSATPYNFNYISRFIEIQNLGSGSLYLGFTANGMKGNNYATIPSGASLFMEWRCTSVFIAAALPAAPFSMSVGLTTIPAGTMPILSGSGSDGSNWQGVG